MVLQQACADVNHTMQQSYDKLGAYQAPSVAGCYVYKADPWGCTSLLVRAAAAPGPAPFASLPFFGVS